MRAELDTLLPDAGGEPTAPLDADALWARGRRRRAVRQLSAATGGLAGVAALALVASGLISGGVGPTVPEIEPMAPSVGTDATSDDFEQDGGDVAVDDQASTPPTLSEEHAASEQRRLTDSSERRPADDSQEPPDAPEDAPTSSVQDVAPLPPPSPSPDADRLASPCALHEGGEPRAFIDVVAPVADQRVEGSVDLVGCSSVPEGTVRFRLSRAGDLVLDGHTTASAGGPGVGEFRETLTLPGSGPFTLEVFWDGLATGEGERDATTVTFEAA